jgi:GAF domain-containing protein
MTRHSKEGRNLKARRRKSVARKRPNAVKAAGHQRKSSAAGQKTTVAQLTRERDEALEQQAAISDILRVISNSPSDVQPVLDSIAQHAGRICKAQIVDIAVVDNEVSRFAASFGQLELQSKDERARTTVPLDRFSVTGRSICDLKPVHVADVQNAGDEFPLGRELAIKFGHRTTLSVPLIREGRALGAILVRRTEVRPFERKHIALLTTFANQAAIAIENVRLFKAEQQRTAELTESLEQQTATSEVLQVISSSPGELNPVFQALLAKAARICEAKFGTLYFNEGGKLRLVSAHDVPRLFAEAQGRGPIQPAPGGALDDAMRTKRTVHVADLSATQPYVEGYPTVVEAVEIGGVRTVVAVPMLKDNELVGVIAIYRQEVRPFTDKQIELLTNFAAQAVIAIENTRLLNELRESLQQQTATADVLKVISRSTFDLPAVLKTLVESAAVLCQADMASILRRHGDHCRMAAHYQLPAALMELADTQTFAPGREGVIGRVLLECKSVQIEDVLAYPEYRFHENARLGGFRTLLGVPLLREGIPIGMVNLMRTEVRPFTEKQIELLETFADQAVIAIENVRLFEAEQQRTRELAESLEQQTATSEVLQVISSSPGDLQPVFERMLEKAVRICDAKFGNIYRWDGSAMRLVAAHNTPPAFAEARRRSALLSGPKTAMGRMVATNAVVHVIDTAADEAYLERDASYVEAVELAGVRTLLVVPLLKDNGLMGAFTVYRQEVRPFAEKQIELVQNFAAQAVIAIENARLLNELRESLQQQTATADVLKVISRSGFDLQAVLDTLVRSAARLCEADTVLIGRPKSDSFQWAASYGYPREYAELIANHPVGIDCGSSAGRALLERKIVHVLDALADPEYTYPLRFADNSEVIGSRTLLGVPLLREGSPIGVMTLGRKSVRPFADKQIELAETFADQAVIAIENVRLLDELRARTDQLAGSVNELQALGEVSQAVNSTLDLETVLSTIVSKAVQLSGTEAGAIYVFDSAQSEFYLRTTYGMDQELIAALTQRRIGLDDPNVQEALAQPEPTQFADLKNEIHTELNEIALRAGFRARLTAPLIRGEDIIGLLVVRRRAAGEFATNTVDLIKTFAAQSAVAIQNARLFESVDTRTRELAKSLDDLRTAQDRLVQTEKLASLGQLTAGIAHEIKNPLNFVNNFSGISVELIDELQEALARVKADDKTRSDIAELAHTLQDNLSKIVQHGKRADSIVKNMLLHSRAGSGEHRPVDINGIVDEAVNLAYHGARAEKQGFNITLERSLDPAAGQVDCFPQEITRMLLNLISNGFYAATTRKGQTEDRGYEPILTAATRNLGDRVEIRIRDNGSGIPPEVREKMFNPFFTTKPAGEGTGLGLSISHDIIVKQHAGSIEVESQPGEFTEFRIVLPRAAASLDQTRGRA